MTTTATEGCRNSRPTTPLAADGVSDKTATAEPVEAERVAALGDDQTTGRLPNVADVFNPFRSFFAPLLDGVEARAMTVRRLASLVPSDGAGE